MKSLSPQTAPSEGKTPEPSTPKPSTPKTSTPKTVSRAARRQLISELKTPRGGLGAKMPLTPRVVQWAEAARTGDAGDASLSGYKSIPDNSPHKYAKVRFEGVPFVWGSKDDRPIHYTDVNQGNLGDCYLMALFAAIARVRPQFIEQMIQSNPDGTYTVTFPGPDGKNIREIVEPVFPKRGTGGAAYAGFGDKSRSRGNEMWPMLIEKAWAQVRKGWLNIEGSKTGGTERYAKGLTGKSVERLYLPKDLSEAELFAQLVSHFVRKKLPVTFYSPKKDSNKKLKKSGIHTNHTYALTAVDTQGKTVDLYNPWGENKDHPTGKDMAFLRRNFASVLFFNLPPVSLKSSSSGPTVEEAVASEAVPKEIVKDSGFGVMVADFEKKMKATSSLKAVRTLAEITGRRLWKDAKAKVQAKTGPASRTDDRPIYWTRLRIMAAMRQFSPTVYSISPVEKDRLLAIFEAASRGRMEIPFGKKQEDHRKVLVSGFDPFGFQYSSSSRRQANPSGAAALALDGLPISAGGITGDVEGVIFPVRFRDFDQNLVERTFRPYMKGKRKVDMIMTISMGSGDLDKQGSKAFELEQYAGRRRSSGAYPDNEGVKAGTEQKPTLGVGLGAGSEFLESSLPYAKIHQGLGRQQTEEESKLEYLPKGATQPVSVKKGGLTPTQLQGARAVEGSGGGYLSNEVFYRTALLRESTGKKVPVGHLHVPRQKPPANKAEEAKHSKLRDRIVAMVKKIIGLALPHIGKKP